MKEKILKGCWVQIHNVILAVGERAPQVPEDTKATPLQMWVKGFLQEDAFLGDRVKISTVTDRIVEGKLVAVNPAYQVDFGEPQPELLTIGRELRKLLEVV